MSILKYNEISRKYSVVESVTVNLERKTSSLILFDFTKDGDFQLKSFFYRILEKLLWKMILGKNFEIHWSIFSNEVMLYNISRFLAF